MGRWRYLNLLILLAVLVFLYMALFTSKSPLAPKALGTAVHPWQPVGPWQARAGHRANLAPGQPAGLEVQFCPGCYRDIRRAGATLAVERPESLDAPSVARVEGAPHRLAARVAVPETACGADVRLWVGAADWSGRVHWAGWPLSASALACDAAGPGQSAGERR